MVVLEQNINTATFFLRQSLHVTAAIPEFELDLRDPA